MTSKRDSATMCLDDQWMKLTHGDVVIAAITSCTNTSNPSVMVAAGLLAKKAVEKGLSVPPYVKTSLAPGSRVVTDYLEQSGADAVSGPAGIQHRRLWLHDLHRQQRPAAGGDRQGGGKRDLVVAAVLSGNRNFEGRINPHVKANYLASPPLVVAYALAGSVDVNIMDEPIGRGRRRPASLPPRNLADARKRSTEPIARMSLAGDVPQAVRQRRRPATTNGTRFRSRAASCSTWTKRAPTSRSRRSSPICRRSPGRFSRSKAPACW